MLAFQFIREWTGSLKTGHLNNRLLFNRSKCLHDYGSEFGEKKVTRKVVPSLGREKRGRKVFDGECIRRSRRFPDPRWRWWPSNRESLPNRSLPSTVQRNNTWWWRRETNHPFGTQLTNHVLSSLLRFTKRKLSSPIFLFPYNNSRNSYLFKTSSNFDNLRFDRIYTNG